MNVIKIVFIIVYVNNETLNNFVYPEQDCAFSPKWLLLSTGKQSIYLI